MHTYNPVNNLRTIFFLSFVQNFATEAHHKQILISNESFTEYNPRL
jgi:hypothetical protein